MGLYYADATLELHHGRAVEVLAGFGEGTVDCVVTSPPYYGIRDYGAEGQYGLEPSVGEYVTNLVALYEQVRRVLAEDGTFWLNLGDSYASRPRGARQARRRDKAVVAAPTGTPDRVQKSLLGVPWRLAFALQDAGWILRNEIIWHKPNSSPESVQDRLATRHEHLFLFTKNPSYYFDLDAIREAHAPTTHSTSAGANPGDVWSIPNQPFTGAHFATFPLEIPRRAIAAGCRPDGTVLDPCSGSGTTGAAAQALGRNYIGIDINAAYLDLSLRTRLQDAPLPLNGP